MSSTSLFFKDALEYELNHQIIIWKLLQDPVFINVFFGQKVSKPHISWEYNKGLFDLAVSNTEDSQPVIMIELKMWSGLSESQLKKQTKYIESNGGKGVYILLGTSGIEFAKNSWRDDIAKKTNNLSRKIGYVELIEGLEKYKLRIDNSSDLRELVNEYIQSLKLQNNKIRSCINPEDRNQKHIYFYAIYQRIRDLYIKDELNLDIYTENNSGGSSYILNDKGSWFEINFEGKQFKLFQEILDGVHLIRLMGENSNNSQRKLANIICKVLQESSLKDDGYDYTNRVSKYMKLARRNLEFEKPNDYEYESSLLIKTHKILNSISKELNE